MSEAKKTPAPAATSKSDAAYAFDEDVFKDVRNNKVWMQDPKYFKKVIVSPSATMMHPYIITVLATTCPQLVSYTPI
ncbi:hypothetical protein V7S43_008491 [Phytophthora oleae]|uniref:Uncharacterized protein n=1 Tax=Phytophthora oleae TaxID=2107226 RepID=A0ABD3FH37_9STRA